MLSNPKLRSKKGFLFVISGPSGSGKTTLAQKILADNSLKRRIVKSVSFTTRPKRTGEINKKDYFFLSQGQFKQELKAKKILEWTSYLGYYYGTPKDQIDKKLAKGKHIILCVDLKGVARLRKLYPKNAVTIFVMPPSLRELETRIIRRCDKTKKAEVLRRVRLAKKEMLEKDKFDFIVINRELDKAVKQLKTILINTIINK